ncbi:MAG TPA: hypothetical protein VKX49_23500 [Bryobacteraceae bacterium]|jgi:hypothetical protein|nr:hypothetical protein [Bryobacteraceae bacterium]
MTMPITKLPVTTSQRQTEFVLQPLKVCQFVPYINELPPQLAAHWSAGLQATASQLQKAPNFAQFETQTLYPPDKSQCFDIAFAVLPESSLGSGRARKQGIALIEANCVNA